MGLKGKEDSIEMKIRTAIIDDSAGIARVQVDSYQRAYAGILPGEYFEHFSYQEQEEDWLAWFSVDGHDPLYVAVAGEGQIVGYAFGQHNPVELKPFESELVALHVRAEYQRRGLGRALFAAVSRALAAQGGHSLFLWIWDGNPARGFYENLGGVLVGSKPWENNKYFGTEIYQVAYGWRDIRTLFKENPIVR